MRKWTPARSRTPAVIKREPAAAAKSAAEVCRVPMTEAEAAAVSAFVAKRKTVKPLPPTKVEMHSGVAHLSFDHDSQAVAQALAANALGTGNVGLMQGLLGQLTDVSRTGNEAIATEVDFTLRLVQGIGPQDEIEALLAAQMAAVHNATMAAARRLNHVENIAQQDSTANALNKLARTFAAQVETLKRYRSGDEPTVKVQRVTVNEGGQAIVGNVQRGGDRDEQPNSLCTGPVERLRKAPRCTTMSKRSRQRCKAPAERNKTVCRFHGARAGAPSGPANGNYRHGYFDNNAIAERRETSQMLRAARNGLRDLLKSLN